MSQDPPAGSASSDLFDNDPAFLKALEELELPELEPPTGADQTQNRQPLKRVHSQDGNNAYMDTDAYGAASFGGFGEYMSRKRAKLQVQNAVLDDSDPTAPALQIFRGLAIYVSLGATFGTLIKLISEELD
jgi:DNA repair protein REV1